MEHKQLLKAVNSLDFAAFDARLESAATDELRISSLNPGKDTLPATLTAHEFLGNAQLSARRVVV